MPDATATVLPLTIAHAVLSLQCHITADTSCAILVSNLPEPEAPSRLHLTYQVLQI